MPARPPLIALLALLGAAAASPALAQVSCTVQVPAMSFGNVNVIGSLPIDATLGSIEVNCANSGSKDDNLQIRTTVSAGRSGDDSQRCMAGPGGALLDYNLFRNANRTQLWRASSNPPDILRVPANGSARLQQSVFGRINGPASASPGPYSDALIATVEF